MSATRASVAHSTHRDSRQAADSLADEISSQLGEPPDALIVFASPSHDHEALLRGLEARLNPKVIVGSTSSGEFTHRTNHDGSACAIAIRSDQIGFQAVVADGLSHRRPAALQKIVWACAARRTVALHTERRSSSSMPWRAGPTNW